MRNNKDSNTTEALSLPGENVNYSTRDFGEIRKIFFMDARITANSHPMFPFLCIKARVLEHCHVTHVVGSLEWLRAFLSLGSCCGQIVSGSPPWCSLHPGKASAICLDLGSYIRALQGYVTCPKAQ